jgi:ribonuclease VapC
MIIDSSALLTMLFREPDADRIATAIAADPRRLASAFNVLESAIVAEARKGEAGGRELDLLAHRIGLDCVPLTESLVEVARAAWRRYGKGRHPAGLNTGDCCAYALARVSGEPLLCTGMDFEKTDIPRVDLAP